MIPGVDIRVASFAGCFALQQLLMRPLIVRTSASTLAFPREAWDHTSKPLRRASSSRLGLLVIPVHFIHYTIVVSVPYRHPTTSMM